MTDFQRKLNHISETPELFLELIEFLCNEFLGSGISRNVYTYALDENWVIKIENRDGEGDNWAEWRIWQMVKHTTDGTKDWFAECSWISNSGKILIQKKTKPLDTKESKIPKKIPAYFTDVKDSNFGWIGNQVVCHDYSHCIERFGYFALTKKMQNFDI